MHAFLTGTVTTVLYLILAAASALIARRLLTIQDELFRKLLHLFYSGRISRWYLRLIPGGAPRSWFSRFL